MADDGEQSSQDGVGMRSGAIEGRLMSGCIAADRGESPRSASDGHGLTRIGHLLPGTYTLTVRAAGYTTAEQQVTVLDADETRVKVVLERLPNE